MHNNKELHLTCNCQTHELHIEREDSPEFDYLDRLWYASFWLRGTSSEKSFKQILRLLWQVIRTGSPYGDEVVLDKAGLEELLVYIQEQLKPFELPKPPEGGTGSSAALPKVKLPSLATINESFGAKKKKKKCHKSADGLNR
jgi:hypothetical protein